MMDEVVPSCASVATSSAASYITLRNPTSSGGRNLVTTNKVVTQPMNAPT